jgi:hypothetical protein
MDYMSSLSSNYIVGSIKAASLSSNYLVGAIKADSPKSNHAVLGIKAISQYSNYNMMLAGNSDISIFKIDINFIKKFLFPSPSEKRLQSNTWKVIDYLNGVKVRLRG